MFFLRNWSGKFFQSPMAANADHSSYARQFDFARTLAHCWIAVAAVGYGLDLLRQTSHGLTNGSGRPFGDDFANYWSGAFLAFHERAAEVYNWHAFHAFQENHFGAALDFYHYSYPPILLLLTPPLAALPYIPALAFWLLSSWYAFYRALRLAMPDGGAWLLALATPALFINALGGQNGAWTAALLGGGLCLLDKRPIIAGIFFGLLSYKPHLGLLLPIALLAGGRWRAFGAAAATVCVLVLISIVMFGADTWLAYLRNVSILRQTILENGTGVWHRMVSVFVFVHRFGGDAWVAYAAQALAAIIAAAIVALAWWKDASPPVRNSLLVLGTCLATPYLQDYDLVVGAFVVVWLAALYPANQLPKAALISAGLLLVGPLVAAVFGKLAGYAIGPLFIIPAFALMAHVAWMKNPEARTRPATAGDNTA